MTTIVKAANAAEFLSLIPRLLGFHATRSLVLVPFSGKRTLGAMRVDLPDASPDGDVDCAASTLIGMVCKVAAADAVAIVVYTDHSFGGERNPARRPRSGDPRIERMPVACVSSTRCASPPTRGGRTSIRSARRRGGRSRSWGSSRTGSTACPSRSATSSRDPTCPSRISPRRSWSADGAACARCGRGRLLSRRQATEACDGGRGIRSSAKGEDRPHRPAGARRGVRLDDAPVLFEQALTWDAAALAPYDAATLIWCLSRPALRDIALVEWCGGLAAGDEALDAQLRWEAGEEYPAHLAMHMWGEGERPEAERLSAGLELARRLAAVAPRARARRDPRDVRRGSRGRSAGRRTPRTTPSSRARSSPSTGSARSCARSCTPGTCRSGRSSGRCPGADAAAL